MHHAPTACVAILCITTTCTGADAPEPATSAQPASADLSTSVQTPSPQRLPGTPPGGLRTWVADIQTGIAGLVETATTDVDAAAKQAVSLYVGRQEWLERYWGSYGILTQGVAPELGNAVMDAEARFHELMVLLAEKKPEPPQIESAVTALRAQLEVVLTKAEAANVALEPPAAAAQSSDQAR